MSGLSDAGQGGGHPFGHFNFYPNGALTQPGCNSSSLYTPVHEITRDSLRAGDVAPGCSHKRSAKYLIASIDEAKDCTLVGYACSDYGAFLRAECLDCQMGHTCAPLGYPAALLVGNASLPSNAKFFLDTNGQSPYCMFAYKIIITLDPGDKAEVTSPENEWDSPSPVGMFCITVYSESEDLVFRTNLNMGASQKPFVTTGDNVFLTYQKGPKMHMANKVVLRYDSDHNNSQAVFVSKVHVVPMPKIGKPLNPLCGPHELTRFVPHSQEEFTPCRSGCKQSKLKIRQRRNSDASNLLTDSELNEYDDLFLVGDSD